MLGGRAKAGIVRVLAEQRVSHVAELAATLGMSKSAVTNALDQLEAAGAIMRRREGREVVAETLPAGESVFRALLDFDGRVKHRGVTPVIGEELDDQDLDALASYFAAPSGVTVQASRWHPDEEALPVGAQVWEQPQGLPEGSEQESRSTRRPVEPASRA
jgi:DNA-binding MarR family transcriptional regulator